VDCNSTDTAYLFWNTHLPKKTLLSQIVTTPPDLPIDGAKAKESKFLGQKFLRLCKSINSLFVSWKQITWQPLSFILLIIIGHFSGSLVPLTFQLRTFQNSLSIKKTREQISYHSFKLEP
jgi:hypothetical protein